MAQSTFSALAKREKICANHVIGNALVFQNKALWYNNSTVCSLIQIIFILGFNWCYGWEKKRKKKKQKQREGYPGEDALIQMGRQQCQAGLTKSSILFPSYPPIMQSFLLKFSKQISIFSNVNQQFLQTNQKVLHFYIFSKQVREHLGRFFLI